MSSARSKALPFNPPSPKRWRHKKKPSYFSKCHSLPRICSKLHSLHYILFHLYIFFHFIIIYCWCLVLMVMSSTLVGCCCSCSFTVVVDVVQRDVFNSACNLLSSLFNIFFFVFILLVCRFWLTPFEVTLLEAIDFVKRVYVACLAYIHILWYNL